jgi:hypothetical protein
MNQDWEYLQAAVEELVDYLHSQVVHWRLSPKNASKAHTQFPGLTVGNICLARARLSAQRDFSEMAAFQQVCGQMDEIRKTWRVNWAKKAEREFGERLRLWKVYVSEELAYEYSANEYRSQIRLRTILEMLKNEVLQTKVEEIALLEALDDQVLSLTLPGGFVWDKESQPSFPEEKFWFLHRKPLATKG